MIIGLLGQSRSGKDTAGAILAECLNGKCVAFADPMKRFCMNALGLTERQLWGDQKEKPISKKQLETSEFKYVLDAHIAARELHRVCEMQLGVYQSMKYSPELVSWWSPIRKEKGLTPRRVLQTFGTEFGRKHLYANVWVDLGISIARRVLDGYDYGRVEGLAKRHGGSDAVIITDVRFRNEILELKRAGAKVYRIYRPDLKVMNHASEMEQQSIPDWWCDGVLYNDSTLESFRGKVIELSHDLRRPWAA